MILLKSLCWESGTTLQNCHDFIASQHLSDTKITGKSRLALGQLKLLIQSFNSTLRIFSLRSNNV